MRRATSFAHMMSSTVLIAARTTLGGYGEPTYGADVAYTAHIGHMRVAVRTGSGQEATSRQVVWLAGTAPIQVTDRITLSTADVGSTEAALTQPPILSVARRNDEYGPHHVAVYLG